jgi:hypothetical protein
MIKKTYVIPFENKYFDSLPLKPMPEEKCFILPYGLSDS